MKLFPSILGVLLLTACGHSDPGENYGDIFQSPQGLVLTREEHLAGWQRSACFSCHLPENIHLENRSSVQGIDLEAIQEIVWQEGEFSCSQCHGSNGVE